MLLTLWGVTPKGSGILRCHVKQRVAALNLAAREQGDRTELLLVRHDDGGDGLVTGRADHVEVDLSEDIATLHVITLGDAGCEALAIQPDGVYSNVDEDLNAGGGLKAVGVAGREGDGHGAIEGGDDETVGGFDADAGAESTPAEELVLDLIEWNHGARDRRGDGAASLHIDACEFFARSQCVGVIFAQDAGAVCSDLLVQGDGLGKAVSRLICVCEVVAGGERVGVVLAQDAGGFCGDLLVQGDGLGKAVSRLICVCEVVAGGERVGVVLAQDAGAVCGDLLIQGDGLACAASLPVRVCEVVA